MYVFLVSQMTLSLRGRDTVGIRDVAVLASLDDADSGSVEVPAHVYAAHHPRYVRPPAWFASFLIQLWSVVKGSLLGGWFAGYLTANTIFFQQNGLIKIGSGTHCDLWRYELWWHIQWPRMRSTTTSRRVVTPSGTSTTWHPRLNVRLATPFLST